MNATPTRRSSKSKARTKIWRSRSLSARVKLGWLNLHLLTHRRNKISRETGNSCNGAFCLISAAKAKFVPSFEASVWVCYDFNNLKYVCLNNGKKKESEPVSEKTMTSTYSAFCCEILSAIDGSAHSNEILDSTLGTRCFESHTGHVVNILVRREFKPIQGSQSWCENWLMCLFTRLM